MNIAEIRRVIINGRPENLELYLWDGWANFK
jgi:hypothetical protein